MSKTYLPSEMANAILKIGPGGGAVENYEELANKPSINGVTLVGNVSSSEFGITDEVQAALAGKQDTLTFDSTPTANSSNPVTSGGVQAALKNHYVTVGHSRVLYRGYSDYIGDLGQYATAEGYANIASGDMAHVEGLYNVANEIASHAEGCGTLALGKYQHVFGKYNVEDDANVYVEIVGNGRSFNITSNARTLDWDGNEWLAGKLTMAKAGTGDNDAVTHKQLNAALVTLSAKIDALTNFEEVTF